MAVTQVVTGSEVAGSLVALPTVKSTQEFNYLTEKFII